MVNLIFDDDSDNDWDRQKVLERLSQVTLPPNVTAQIGPDFSPIGSIYWYTLKTTNPAYDVMELKSLQDWVITKYMKSVPDVVDDSSFGGITREYQVRIDPDKLISYGLSLAQVEQQLTNSQCERRRKLHRARLAADQRPRRGLGHQREGHRKDRAQDAKRHGAARQRHRGRHARAEDPSGPDRQSDPSGDGVVVDDNDVVEGIVFMRKGADTATTLDGIHAMVQRLNDHILPPGVKIVPYLDRDDLVHYTTHTVLHNLRRHDPGRDHPLHFPGQCPRRHHRGADHSLLRCCLLPSVWTCGTFPPTCSPWAPWTSAWSWMERWSWSKTSSAI